MAENYGSLEGTLDAHDTLEGEMNNHSDLTGEIQFGGCTNGVKDVKVNNESVVDENKVANIDLTPYAEIENVYDKQTIDTALEGKADTDDIPTALSQLDNDANYVQDADYVHTDNNFTDEDKTAIGGIPENITDLSDVEVSNIQNGQVLKWDATQNKFVNANESGGGSGDVADVKVNGTSVVDPVTKEANIDLTDYAKTEDIPTDLADLSDDATHRLVTDTEKSTWDNKVDVSDIPTVNNPTITIQKNGQNVDTFTLNQTTNKVIDISVPTKTSDLQNDSSFITNTVNNLANYYLKSDTYTQTEVNNLISAAVNGRFEKVTTLPASGEPNVIYLVPKTTALTNNVYDEYIWQDNAWELLGSTEIDLSNYVTTTDLSTALADYVTSSTFNTTIANYYTKTEIGNLLDGKVDKVSGKGLSTNDYDNTAKGIVDNVTTNLANKVNKSGDTMTGSLTIQRDDGLSTLYLISPAKENVGRANAMIQKNANASSDSGVGITDYTWGNTTQKTVLRVQENQAQLKNKLRLAVTDANNQTTNYCLYGEHNKPTSSDVTGLGTAAVKNVPESGNASDTEVVMGNDTRLSDVDTLKNRADNTTTSASGNPISISGLKSNQLAINPIITFEPIQAGSGTPSPSNIRTISGYDKIEVLSCGKNLFDKSEVVLGGLDATTGEETSSTTTYRSGWIRVKASTTYVLSGFANVIRPYYYGQGGAFIERDSSTTASTFTTPSGCAYVRFQIASATWTGTSNPQLEEAQTATTYTPYNKTTSISESLGQTVYGGSLDVRSGIFTKIWGYIASYAGETLPSEWISDRNEYVSGTTPTTGAEVAYKLASANYATIQLTPHEISLLKDYAYVSTNGTTIALAYHNGELASLSDVAQLSETVERLTEYIKELINNV